MLAQSPLLIRGGIFFYFLSAMLSSEQLTHHGSEQCDTDPLSYLYSRGSIVERAYSFGVCLCGGGGVKLVGPLWV